MGRVNLPPTSVTCHRRKVLPYKEGAAIQGRCHIRKVRVAERHHAAVGRVGGAGAVGAVARREAHHVALERVDLPYEEGKVRKGGSAQEELSTRLSGFLIWQLTSAPMNAGERSRVTGKLTSASSAVAPSYTASTGYCTRTRPRHAR